MEFPLSLSHKDSRRKTSESSSSKLEKKLGLETPTQRALEASLFIDKKFLDVAVITGNTQAPEKLFGKDAWEGYLSARKFLRQYGNGDLNIDFIRSVHQKLMQTTNSDLAGRIRDTAVRAGNYNDPQKPVAYTEGEVKNIKANPYLKFQPAEKEGNIGFIYYPFSEDGDGTEEYINKLLQETCDWYNEEKNKEGISSYKLAAQLQRRLISIHHFFDGNGAASRLIMNWSLENNGGVPSALDDPSNDILTSEENWIIAVESGSKKYKEAQERQKVLEKAGITDIAYVLGVSPEKAFYDYIYKHIKGSPRLFSSNGMQDHQEFQKFFSDFIDELRKFQQFLQPTTTIGDKTITQGGLISSAFIKLTQPGTTANPDLTNSFFSDVKIYRGGSLDIEDINDPTILDLMTSFTAVGTGYRALEKSYLPAVSSQKVSSAQIEESMDYYNKLVGKLYFKKRHPQENPYEAVVGDLEDTIRAHTSGGKYAWVSPFVSTSFSYQQSRMWASGTLSKNGYGVLFSGSVPKEGAVLSFGQKNGANKSDIQAIDASMSFPTERECLIAGGINPNSVDEIRIVKKGQIMFIARRIQGETATIEINNVQGQFVRQKTYEFIDGEFKLVKDIQTEIPSRVMIAQIPEEPPIELPEPYEQKYTVLDLPIKYLAISNLFDKKGEFYNITEIKKIYDLKNIIFDKDKKDKFDKFIKKEKKNIFPPPIKGK